MHYVSLALYAEGPTDYYFLRPLLQRLCADLCARGADGLVDINDEVLALDHPASLNEAPRAERIAAAADEARGAWNILFVHADGANNPLQARAQQIDPALVRLSQEFRPAGTGVAVMPIRETEAWAIADGQAFRQVFGTGLSDAELGLPTSPKLAETITDPKATLKQAFKATGPTGPRKTSGIAPYLNALGEQVSLARLRETTAFCVLENELQAALRDMGVLRRTGV